MAAEDMRGGHAETPKIPLGNDLASALLRHYPRLFEQAFVLDPTHPTSQDPQVLLRPRGKIHVPDLYIAEEPGLTYVSVLEGNRFNDVKFQSDRQRRTLAHFAEHAGEPLRIADIPAATGVVVSNLPDFLDRLERRIEGARRGTVFEVTGGFYDRSHALIAHVIPGRRPAA